MNKQRENAFQEHSIKSSPPYITNNKTRHKNGDANGINNVTYIGVGVENKNVREIS